MKNRVILIIITVMSFDLCTRTNMFAFQFTEEVCKKYNLGSSWYCENYISPENNEQAYSPEDIMDMPINSSQKAELLNQLWESQRKQAVITGKKEDLEKLLITQRFIAQKGTDFARNMVRFIEMHPEYSNTSSYYKNIAEEYLERSEKALYLQRAKDHYSLAMVYSSSCPYCLRQLPIILSLKEQTGIKTIGVSVDGKFYKGFDANVHDETAAFDPNIISYPTILLIDNKNLKRIFVSKGLTTKDELENRIYRILKEKENDNE